MVQRSIQLIAVVAFAACAPRTLPPPAAPAREAPAVDRASIPPVPDSGQVILDTVDGPADVEHILSSTYAVSTAGHRAFGQQTARLCTTPCIANLPYGEHELRFQLRGHPRRISSTFVKVTATPTIHRYAVGALRTHPGGTIGGLMLASLGGSLGLTGLGVGVGIDNRTLMGVGVGGLAAAVVGLVIMRSSRTEIQPGIMTSWPAE